MKHLKILALAAAAAMALMAFGAGMASATTLDNGAGEHLSTGTTIDLSLVDTLKLESTSGTVLDTCMASTFSGATSNTGSVTETVKAPISIMTWTNCTTTTHNTQLAEFEIHHIAGTRNGTVTAAKFETTTALFGGTCTYGFSSDGSMVDIGTLTGSDTTPIFHFNVLVVERTGDNFLCPNDMRWSGTYHVTSPSGLTVTAG
jgi:hypothetical protein